MRKTVVFIPFLLFSVWTLTAGPQVTVESMSFIPQTYYVGDRVEMRIVLGQGGDMKLLSPVKPKNPPWGVVHDISLIPTGGKLEVRVVFTSFQPGTQTFPPLKIGEFVLDDLKVHVGSLIEEGYGEFAPPRGQILLPSTRLILGLIVGGFFALPLLGVFLFFWVRPRIERFQAFYRERRPYKELRRRLRDLQKDGDGLDARRFYIALLENLKMYFSHRGKQDCAAMTTREMQNFITKRFSRVENIEELVQILLFGDEVKFGGRRATKKKRHEDLQSVIIAVESIEKGEGRVADI